MIGILLFCVVLFLSYKLYLWGISNQDYFEIRNVKFWKPVFLLGSSWRLFLRKNNSQEFVKLMYDSKPGEKVVGFFDGLVPIFVLKDLDMIKKIAIKDFDNFEDHRAIINSKTDRLFGNTLIVLKGKKWRDMRSTLSPAFTGTKMRQMFELVVECAKSTAAFYEKEASTGKRVKVEVKNTFARFTNDVIASCAFGLKTDSLENPDNEFYTIGSKMFKAFGSARGITKILLIRAFPTIMYNLGIEFMDAYVRKFFHKVILETMAEREKQHIVRPDMINILMHIRKGTLDKVPIEKTKLGQETAGFAVVEDYDVAGKTTTKKTDWSDDEIVAQAFIFFAAGFDTTSTLLQFAAYELATNPEVQAKLVKEVDQVNEELNGGSLTYDTLPKLKYMDMVVSEALRKWPALPFVDRMCIRDYHYQDEKYDFKIKKDEAAIWVPVHGFHYDPKYFPNPEKFDPERFSDENKDNLNMAAYMPFGVGPRNCIGSRFALMEIKSILFYILLNFNIIPCEETKVPMVLKKMPFGLQSKDIVKLEFKKRNK